MAVIAVVHFDSRSFSSVLSYIGHLLLLSEHLNLHLLLFRERHEVIENVTTIISWCILTRHIFGVIVVEACPVR